jgi:hypothetical protein
MLSLFPFGFRGHSVLNAQTASKQEIVRDLHFERFKIELRIPIEIVRKNVIVFDLQSETIQTRDGVVQ